jgi:hypothetical protein
LSGYSFTLFLHFVFLLAAVAAAALSGFAALSLRRAETATEAIRWGASVRRVVPVFPIASLGLIGTGAYMTSKVWSWSTPWIIASLGGLIAIILLGAGVEGSRGRAALAELHAAGLSERAKRLLRDPLAWSARVTIWTLLIGVIFVMTTKPSGIICVAALSTAIVCGVLGALPFWVGPASSATSNLGLKGDGT